MPSFKGQISDDEIDQLLTYIRLQSGNLKTAAPFVPNPDGQIIKSQKQNFRIEIVASGLDTPWGEAFLPDGRLLVTERSGHIRIIDKDGKLDAWQEHFITSTATGKTPGTGATSPRSYRPSMAASSACVEMSVARMRASES